MCTIECVELFNNNVLVGTEQVGSLKIYILFMTLVLEQFSKLHLCTIFGDSTEVFPKTLVMNVQS